MTLIDKFPLLNDQHMSKWYGFQSIDLFSICLFRVLKMAIQSIPWNLFESEAFYQLDSPLTK